MTTPAVVSPARRTLTDSYHRIPASRKTHPRRLKLHADHAYNECMQYTLRNVPPNIDQAVRERARAEGKSLNEVVLDALRSALGLSGGAGRQRDLADIAATWVDDPAAEAALWDQRKIDPDMWR